MLKDKMKDKKKIIIIVAVILALIIAAGSSYYFIFGRYTTRSNYGKTANFLQVSANEMSFQYYCPYKRSSEFKLQENIKVTVSETTEIGKVFARMAEIESVKYEKTKTKNAKLAWITVTIKMGSNFKFTDKSIYKIEISENAIKEMKSNYSLGKISFSVLCEESGVDHFLFTKTDSTVATQKELKDVKFKFERKGEKTYLVAIINNDAKFTRLNSLLMASNKTSISLLVSPKGQKTLYRFFWNNITGIFYYDNGKSIKLSVEIKEKGILYSGEEYTLRLCKGLLTDKEGKIISADYWGKCTYVA